MEITLNYDIYNMKDYFIVGEKKDYGVNKALQSLIYRNI